MTPNERKKLVELYNLLPSADKVTLLLRDALPAVPLLLKQVEELEACYDVASGSNQDFMRQIRGLQAKNAELEAEVARLKADERRLNWLEERRYGVLPGVPSSKHDYWFVRPYGATPAPDGRPTIREAIDYAQEVLNG